MNTDLLGEDFGTQTACAVVDDAQTETVKQFCHVESSYHYILTTRKSKQYAPYNIVEQLTMPVKQMQVHFV